MTSHDCFEKGLLKRVNAGREQVLACISLADHYVERASGNLKIGYFDVAFLMAYNSMFQAARALLFNDGVKERSHYCVAVYLREKLGRDASLACFVELLDTYRQNRHLTQYEGEFVSREEAENAVKHARLFLSAVKEKLKF